MADFNREESIYATEIREIQIILNDPNGDNSARSGRIRINIEMSNSQIVRREYDLIDHISQGTINAIISFLDTMRTQAETQILPAS